MRIGSIERGEVVPWHLLLRPVRVRVLVLLTCMMAAQTRLKVRK